MGCILLQSDNSPKALAAISHFESTSECHFDYTRSGSRLTPIIFNSRANLDHKQEYHSFVSDIVCSRWARLTLT